jgi:hypothetical protein
MKKISRFLLFVLTIATLVLSACGGTAVTPAVTGGGGKVEPIPAAFIGLVERIAGDQWVINGQTVTVSPGVIRNGPFNVGDQVKVEGLVKADGSFAVSKVEAPPPQDASALPQFGDDNSNASNANDANVNDANSNAVNSNDVNANDANSNDDNSNSLNSNDASGNDANSNDDNGIDANSNEANGNDVNSNDDNGSNGNSDDSNNNDNNTNSDGGDDHGGGNDNGGNDNSGGEDHGDNGNGG